MERQKKRPRLGQEVPFLGGEVPFWGQKKVLGRKDDLKGKNTIF